VNKLLLRDSQWIIRVSMTSNIRSVNTL
jgi:hypothetical protein